MVIIANPAIKITIDREHNPHRKYQMLQLWIQKDICQKNVFMSLQVCD